LIGSHMSGRFLFITDMIWRSKEPGRSRSMYLSLGVFLCVHLLLTFPLGAASERDDQYNGMMCGPHCLWLAAKRCGVNISLERARRLVAPDLRSLHKGTSVQSMLQAAQTLGLRGEVVATSLEGLSRDPRSAILIVDDDTHYVFLKRIDSPRVSLIDSMRPVVLSREALEKRWGGLAIMIGTSEDVIAAGSRYSLVTILLSVSGAAGIVAGGVFLVHALRKTPSSL